jgi:hypothetical protein
MPKRKVTAEESSETTEVLPPSPSAAKRRKPTRREVGYDEARVAHESIFQVAATVVRSHPDWTDQDFEFVARAFVGLVRRYPAAAVILDALTPIIYIGGVLSLVRKLIGGRAKPQEGSEDADADGSTSKRQGVVRRFQRVRQEHAGGESPPSL